MFDRNRSASLLGLALAAALTACGGTTAASSTAAPTSSPAAAASKPAATSAAASAATKPAASAAASAAAKPAASTAASAGAATFTPAMQKVIDQVKAAPGQVVLSTGSSKYTSTEETQFTQAFDKFFGVTTQVKLFSPGGGPAFVGKLREEAKAGIKPAADLASVSAQLVPSNDPLRVTVDWASLGFSDDNIDHDVNAPLSETSPRSVIYNTKLIPQVADAPHKFEDLLDPKWKGKIVTEATPASFSFISLVIGDQPSFDLVQHLMDDQKMTVVASNSDVRQRVINGEFAVGYAGTTAGEDKAKGAPIDNAPVKVGAQVNHLLLIANSPDPLQAQLFAYFISQSPDGSKLAQDVLDWNKYTTPGSETYQMNQTAGLVLPPPGWVENQQNALIDKFKTIVKS